MIQREELEQRRVMEWAAWMITRYPELDLLHHIPNGGKRLKTEASRLKLAGVKPGVPDLCLPVPRGKYHGLYIELKADRGRVSENQHWWINALEDQGYMAMVCFGADEATSAIEAYLGLQMYEEERIKIIARGDKVCFPFCKVKEPELYGNSITVDTIKEVPDGIQEMIKQSHYVMDGIGAKDYELELYSYNLLDGKWRVGWNLYKKRRTV